MWCHRCKLDVPPQQQPHESVLRCGVCAAVLPGAALVEHVEASEPAAATVSPITPTSDASRQPEATTPAEPSRVLRRHDPCPDLHDEQLDEELAEVRRLIRRTSHWIVSPWEADDAFSLADCLPAQPCSAAQPFPTPQSCPAPQVAAPPASELEEAVKLTSGRWWAAGGWFLVCLGAMGLVFSSVLFTATGMGSKGSSPVWPLCLLSAFAGQFLVVLGFMLRCSVSNESESKPAKSCAEAEMPAAPVVPQPTPPALRPHTAPLHAPTMHAPATHTLHRPPWSETVERALSTVIDSNR